MKVTYDEAKRAATLASRELDFVQATEIFDGQTFTMEDDRQDYGEVRYQTVGYLGPWVVMVVWTPRGEARHVLSMRKCNAREKRKFKARLDRS